MRHQRVALALILPVALAPALKASVLGSVFGGGHAIVAAAASRGTGAVLDGGRAGAQGGTAAGVAGAAGTTGAASTTGTVVAGATAAGGLATAGAGAYAAGVVAGGPAAALATDLTAAGGGAAVASALAGSSATGMMVKMAIAAIAIATGAVGTILGPRVIPGLPSIVSGSPAPASGDRRGAGEFWGAGGVWVCAAGQHADHLRWVVDGVAGAFALLPVGGLRLGWRELFADLGGDVVDVCTGA